jgi:hypothetical protein
LLKVVIVTVAPFVLFSTTYSSPMLVSSLAMTYPRSLVM